MEFIIPAYQHKWWLLVNHRPLGSKEAMPGRPCPLELISAMGVENKRLLSGILTYVEITSSGINCALKNLRGGKSRSGKCIKKGIGLHSFIS